MPGAKLDGASVYELLNTYKVTFTAAVPTVWLMLLQHMETTGGKLPHLKRVVIGGSACPRAMTETFQDKYGVDVIHAWGMTEMSPLGTLCTIKPEYAALSGEATPRRQAEAGPSAVRRRDEDHRRRRQATAVGRKDFRPAEGARAGGGQAPISRARAIRCSTKTASSTPATSPPSTPRLHADHRPRQGRDQVRRRVDLLHRAREPWRPATRRSRRPP